MSPAPHTTTTESPAAAGGRGETADDRPRRCGRRGRRSGDRGRHATGQGRPFGDDTRGVSTAVTHVLAIGITTILITGLLMTASGLVEDQRENAAREKLTNVGQRLANQLAAVDDMARTGAQTSIEAQAPSRIAGSTYTVIVVDCPSGTCLRLTSNAEDVSVRVPIQNESGVTVQPLGSGRFRLGSTVPTTGVVNATAGVYTGVGAGIGVGENYEIVPLVDEGVNSAALEPKASFKISPDRPTARIKTKFNATDSVGFGSPIVGYQWEFERIKRDGSIVPVATRNGQIVRRQFDSGRYLVNLTITTRDGRKSSDSKLLLVTGLEYMEDVEAYNRGGGVKNNCLTFRLNNTFQYPVQLQEIILNPSDDTIDVLNDGHDPGGGNATSEISFQNGAVDSWVSFEEHASNPEPELYSGGLPIGLRPDNYDGRAGGADFDTGGKPVVGTSTPTRVYLCGFRTDLPSGTDTVDMNNERVRIGLRHRVLDGNANYTNDYYSAQFFVQPGAPTVKFGGTPYWIKEGRQNKNVDGAPSKDLDGSNVITDYEWTIVGDPTGNLTLDTTGAPASGNQTMTLNASAVSVTYTRTATLRLTVTDNEGLTSSKEIPVEIRDVGGNTRPNVSLSYSPTNPDPGERVEFDASGSSDSDGSLDTFKFDFDGDGVWDANSSTPTLDATVNHTYTSEGLYNARVRVLDDDGAPNTTTTTVGVGTSVRWADPGVRPGDGGCDRVGSSCDPIRLTATLDPPQYGETLQFDSLGPSVVTVGSATSTTDGFGRARVGAIPGATGSTVVRANWSKAPSREDLLQYSVVHREDFEGATSLADSPYATNETSYSELDTGGKLGGSKAVEIKSTGGGGHGGVGIVSPRMDTAEYELISVDLTVQEGDGGDTPDSNDDGEALVISFENDNGNWEKAKTIPVTDTHTTHDVRARIDDTDAFHSDFRIRVSMSQADAEDPWYFDDVTVSGIGGPVDPVAAFTYSPGAPGTGDTVTFDASTSKGLNGSIISYAWDFDGDGSADTTSGTPTATHTYGTSGVWPVELTVTTDTGATDSVTVDVPVGNTIAWVDVTSAPGTGTAQYDDMGPPMRLTADVAPAASGTTVQYSSDTSAAVSISETSNTTDSNGLASTHVRFRDTGDAALTAQIQGSPSVSDTLNASVLELYDFEGASDLGDVGWSRSDSDSDVSTGGLLNGSREALLSSGAESGGASITSPTVDTSGYEMVVVEFRAEDGGVGGNDPEASANEDLDFAYRDDDGNWVQNHHTVFADPSSGDEFHVRVRLGGDANHSNFQVRFAQDSSTYWDTWSIDNVRIVGVGSGGGGTGNAAPTAAFNVSPSSPSVGQSVSFTDASSDSDGSIAARQWDFGDGTTSTAQNPTHAYGSAGTYTVSLTVTDDDGATNTTTQTVTVGSGGTTYRFNFQEPSSTTPPTFTADTGKQFGTNSGPIQYGWTTGNNNEHRERGTSEPQRKDTLNHLQKGGANETWEAALPDGEYQVTVVAGDPSYTDQRNTLRIEDTTVVDPNGKGNNFDEYTTTVTVTDGRLTVHATGNADNAKLAYVNITQTAAYAGSWSTPGDWDATTGTSVVHESLAGYGADVLRLGIPTDGSRWNADPVAYYPLEEDGGTTATDVAGSNDGTISGSATLGATGVAGTGGYEFSRNPDSGISVSDDPSLRFGGDFTVSAWIRSSSIGNYADSDAAGQTFLVDKQNWGDKEGFSLMEDGQYSDEIKFRVLGNGGYDDVSFDTSDLNDGNWHHVVGVRDGAETRIYLDGVLKDTQSGTAMDTGSTSLAVGGRGGRALDGGMDEVSLYDAAMSDAEVEDLYNASTYGSVVTGGTSFGSAVSPGSLTLTGVNASVPAGTTLTVSVQSDPDGDGTYEETSGAVSLSGTQSSYSVPTGGLTQNSDTYRLVVVAESSDPTATPLLDAITLESS